MSALTMKILAKNLSSKLSILLGSCVIFTFLSPSRVKSFYNFCLKKIWMTDPKFWNKFLLSLENVGWGKICDHCPMNLTAKKVFKYCINLDVFQPLTFKGNTQCFEFKAFVPFLKTWQTYLECNYFFTINIIMSLISGY